MEYEFIEREIWKNTLKSPTITSVNHIQNNLKVISSFINIKYWRVYNEDQLNDAAWTNTCDWPIKTDHISFTNPFGKACVICKS